MQTKKIVILGAGESGIGAALLAKKQGYNVLLSDGGVINQKNKITIREHNIPFEEEQHTLKSIQEADIVIKSPGIMSSNSIIQFCKENYIDIIDEIEFAYQYVQDSTVISITGTNGKTTTAKLIYHIIKSSTDDVALVGNVGNSFAKQVATDPKSIYVVEVSSFQLDYIKNYHSDIAILTNITPDHLDAYNYKMENYIHSKFQICTNQTSKDIFIYNKDDHNIKTNLDKYPIQSIQLPFSLMKKNNETSAYVENDQILIKYNQDKTPIPLATLPLLGKHNQYNTMAAGLATSALKLRKETIQKAIISFQAVDHRMEFVSTFQGVTFINDSKATNINATWYAIESMNKPVILLLGGKDKGNNYEDIMDVVKEKVKGIVCIGVDNTKIINAFKGKITQIEETESMEVAVQKAFAMSERGDIVLLSPSCASFDLFDNYQDRGNKFKEAIMHL